MNAADAKLFLISIFIFGLLGPFIGAYYVASPIHRNESYFVFFMISFFVGFPLSVITAIVWWGCLKLPKLGFALVEKYSYAFIFYTLILPGILGFFITSLILRQFNELSSASFVAGSLCGILSIVVHRFPKIEP